MTEEGTGEKKITPISGALCRHTSPYSGLLPYVNPGRDKGKASKVIQCPPRLLQKCITQKSEGGGRGEQWLVIIYTEKNNINADFLC